MGNSPAPTTPNPEAPSWPQTHELTGAAFDSARSRVERNDSYPKMFKPLIRVQKAYGMPDSAPAIADATKAQLLFRVSWEQANSIVKRGLDPGWIVLYEAPHEAAEIGDPGPNRLFCLANVDLGWTRTVSYERDHEPKTTIDYQELATGGCFMNDCSVRIIESRPWLDVVNLTPRYLRYWVPVERVCVVGFVSYRLDSWLQPLQLSCHV